MLVDNQTRGEAPTMAPTRDAQQPEKSPSFLVRAQRILLRTPVAVVALVMGLITLFIHGYRVDTAPDVFSDEGLYIQVGINLARGFGLVVNHNLFLWHPPVYMLLEAAYIRLAGLTNSDALTTLLAVRNVNVFFSALTAMLIVFFGHKIHSSMAGVAAAILFILDPYVQRINRRSMLETVAMFCILLGLYIFFTNRPRLTKWQRLGSGIAFGLALLTKEAVFPELLVLIAYVIFFNRNQFRDAAWVFATSCAIYLIYPVWIVALGQGNSYIAFKLFGLTRIASLITGHKAAPPAGTYLPVANKLTFSHNIISRIVPYATSYLLIGCAGILTIILFLRFRHIVAARYLIVWSIFSFAFGSLLINISDQYAYFLIVPSTIVVGYVFTLLFEVVLYSPTTKKVMPEAKRQPFFSWTSIRRMVIWQTISVVFLAVFLYNSYLWIQTYATGTDDGYIKTIRYVTAHIPAGTTIVTSDDVTVYLLPSSYNIRLDRNTKTIIARHECYFIMSSKDSLGEYDAMTPEFYAWVMQGTHPLFEQRGPSFGEIGIYQQIATKEMRNEICNH